MGWKSLWSSSHQCAIAWTERIFFQLIRSWDGIFSSYFYQLLCIFSSCLWKEKQIKDKSIKPIIGKETVVPQVWWCHHLLGRENEIPQLRLQLRERISTHCCERNKRSKTTSSSDKRWAAIPYRNKSSTSERLKRCAYCWVIKSLSCALFHSIHVSNNSAVIGLVFKNIAPEGTLINALWCFSIVLDRN